MLDGPKNKLLNLLPPRDLERISGCLERVPLKARRVLHHAKTPMDYVYFVEDGLVSVLASTGEGKAIEVWLIGREGMAGVPAILGGNVTDHRRIVQVGGSALRMSVADLRRAIEEVRAFRDLLLSYVRVVLLQTSQSGACNAAHSVQERLARWLLTARDRNDTEGLPLTHEMLARMLGVRRATVTGCIAIHEREGILRSSRGHVAIADRQRLEELACNCYRKLDAARERFYREFQTAHPRVPGEASPGSGAFGAGKAPMPGL